MYLFNRKCVGWCHSASSHPVTYSHMLKSELLLQYIMRHRLTLPLKCIQFDNLNYCCLHQTALNNYSLLFAQMHAHDLLNLYQVLHTLFFSFFFIRYALFILLLNVYSRMNIFKTSFMITFQLMSLIFGNVVC